MGNKKEDQEMLLDVGYKKQARRSFWVYVAGTLAFLSFAITFLLAGYYFGRYYLFPHQDQPDYTFDTAFERYPIDNGGLFADDMVWPDPEPEPGDYYVGMGRFDVTGPIAEVNMMGYAVPSQIAHGLHMRLYSRAFIFSDLEKKSRAVFVSIDSGMGSQIIKLEVVKRLKAKYGDMYNEKNVVLSGTHSHSGPAGFFQFLLFEVTSLGFIKQSTDSFIDGVVKSIEMAHDNMQKANLVITSGDVDDANINRSPSAYTHNPEEERAKYEHNTEHEMTLLKIVSPEGAEIGLVNWFPVHGTCMNNTNELISSDNKGRASTLYESSMRKEGKADFVAAFAQANLGDVSPNTAGPKCIDTGKPCDYEQSTCNFPPRVKYCIAFGPGKDGDMFQSTDIIGTRQFDAAKRILSAHFMPSEFEALICTCQYPIGPKFPGHIVEIPVIISPGSERIQGPVGFAHQYVDMTKEEVTLSDGTKATTCKPGMGYSFAAGTTDGPGALNFRQSMTEGTPLWKLATKLIGKIVCKTEPPQSYFDCHKPKPVLLPTGYMDIPYAWHPSVVDVQLLRVGQLIIAAVPGEFTTMAGRRLKDAVRAKAIEQGMPSDTKVVIAGLSNVYTHYIATLEEFGAQRYEGASTIFGPHSHAAYVHRFTDLVGNLVNGTAADPGPNPENILPKQIELLPKPRPDRLPAGKKYGDLIKDAEESYITGGNVVVKFYGSNPRHDMKLGKTYLEVQRLDSAAGNWDVAFTDADWETKFRWERLSNTNASREELTVIDGIFNLIAAITGYHINLNRMEALMNNGEFSASDLELNENGLLGFESARSHLIKNLVKKGILSPAANNLKSDYPDTDESHVTIEWDVPSDQQEGTYRIVYLGDHLSESGDVTSFQGMTSEFQIRK